MKSINKNPVLDIALIVFIKTLLVSGLNHEEKKQLRANIFGIEPTLNFMEVFSRKLEIMINLFNFDSNEEIFKSFNKKNGKIDPPMEMNLILNNGSFSLVTGIEKAESIYFYEEGNEE